MKVDNKDEKQSVHMVHILWYFITFKPQTTATKIDEHVQEDSLSGVHAQLISTIWISTYTDI
jgi:hypothetical protein